ncbi:hypothetical protein QBC39DRAFT_344811 [Podospora conica]|nr:hypothetical protein QBC39DRAFT_344811 [Schizothecium conicum]
MPVPESQTLDRRYIDDEKLLTLLKSLFGIGNFTIEYDDDDVKLTIPYKLSLDQEKSVEW